MQMNASSFPQQSQQQRWTDIAYPHLPIVSLPSTRLLLAETDRLLDSPRELLRERVVALVRRQVETVEARVRLGQL
jgi:hypothetical protein